MIRRLSRLTAPLALLAVACQGPPPDAYVSGGTGGSTAAVPIGANEQGEPCRYQLGGGNVPGARREAVIYCGNLDFPVGRVAEIGDGSDPGQLAALATSGAWRGYIEQRFSCGSPTGTTLAGGASAQLLQCTRRVGGWPHLAMTAAVGGRIFAADAVRPALPAVEATLGALTGQAPAAATASGSEARRLIAQRTAGENFGAGDEARFFELTRLGDAYNNIDNPAAAERAYREALAIQQKVLGPEDPGLALTTMKLAAQIAHQQSGAEAEQLLTRANQLITKASDPLLAAQLQYYRSIALAYQGKIRESLALVQGAEDTFGRLAPEALARGGRTQAASGGAPAWPEPEWAEAA